MPHWLASAHMWHDIFVPGVPLAEKILRPLSSTFFWWSLLRVFGKRELAQLNPFDLVVLLSLSNTVQNAIIGNDNSLTGGLIGAFALLVINYLVVRFLFRHRRLDQIFEGKPTTLIENGCIVQQRPGQGAADPVRADDRAAPPGVRLRLDEVEQCVLEPGGTFYIQRKLPAQDEVEHDEVMKALTELNGKLDRLLPGGVQP